MNTLLAYLVLGAFYLIITVSYHVEYTEAFENMGAYYPEPSKKGVALLAIIALAAWFLWPGVLFYNMARGNL